MPEKGSKPQRRAVVLVFGAGGDQRKVENTKTSSGARFRRGGPHTPSHFPHNISNTKNAPETARFYVRVPFPDHSLLLSLPSSLSPSPLLLSSFLSLSSPSLLSPPISLLPLSSPTLLPLSCPSLSSLSFHILFSLSSLCFLPLLSPPSLFSISPYLYSFHVKYFLFESISFFVLLYTILLFKYFLFESISFFVLLYTILLFI